ncbi:malonyl-ACP O-methyltransferase BioC [Agarivorans sp. Toyoura001]|uniref:malonyl-ACP O-methyltransferase BioC n=1 Tax=unclassified Agarivorans TaxID=2636026 RepID=UPI0010D4AF3F|nr:malonyl-ACP O-methyltransferase BioC [Agarivorans sp. Toyoura001]GDY27422.1 biotin synthesis protein BioC [Agarivorans sp. Toyoura001]
MIIDKEQVARHFSKAVDTYNDFAGLQRDIGHRLLQEVPNKHYPLAMDLGCGTGFFAKALQSSSSQVIGIDLSHAMASQAKRVNTGIAAVVADAEQLSLANDSVDLVFSNLALQWCNDLSTALSEIKRVLKPGGVAVFSTLLDGTLYELKQSWSELNQYRHVNHFISADDVAACIQLSRFKNSRLIFETETLWYQQALSLLAELKGIGANYVIDGKPNASNATQLKKMVSSYKQQFANPAKGNRVSATYKVCYGVLIND